ncbi:MAG: hypothetical protein GTN53_05710 [Candidatus Aminicenantes bacterium]|nr:hypothetical protein [Candidatus Aminicenantes bacterium]NIT21984.1 hypothetical protein [Candidatus Aminicenantes bacterium]
MSYNAVSSIREDHNGVLWIGTRGGGLNRFNRETEAFTRYINDPHNPNSPGCNYIYTIYVDRYGVMWLGTSRGGLNRFDPQKETFIHYKYDPSTPNSLSNNIVLSICESQNGVLWIGTWGGGLNKFNRQKQTFTRYTTKKGLPDNHIYSILEDNQGNLWLGTNKGLCRFSISTGKTKIYTPVDGLQDYEFNTGACYQSQSGEMFFGGVNGFNCFYPDRIEDNHYIPPIVITGFKIQNRPVNIGKDSRLKKHITETKEIILSYKDSFFSFEFAALDYTAPDKNRYQYKVERFNEDWIDLGHKHDITLTNLDPGEYILRVRGANNDGIWNYEGTSVRIIITPPLWETWWFRALTVLLLAALLYIWHHRRMKNLSLKLKTEAEMERLFAKYKVSGREQEIIRLILKGKSNKDIEDDLYISIKTVKSHIYNIYQKLGVKNRLELIHLIQRSANQ